MLTTGTIPFMAFDAADFIKNSATCKFVRIAPSVSDAHMFTFAGIVT
jgi:hypothetical protein